MRITLALTPPTLVLFIITLVLAAVACIGQFKKVPGLNALSFLILLGAYVVLVIGVLFKGI